MDLSFFSSEKASPTFLRPFDSGSDNDKDDQTLPGTPAPAGESGVTNPFKVVSDAVKKGTESASSSSIGDVISGAINSSAGVVNNVASIAEDIVEDVINPFVSFDESPNPMGRKLLVLNVSAETAIPLKKLIFFRNANLVKFYFKKEMNWAYKNAMLKVVQMISPEGGRMNKKRRKEMNQAHTLKNYDEVFGFYEDDEEFVDCLARYASFLLKSRRIDRECDEPTRYVLINDIRKENEILTQLMSIFHYKYNVLNPVLAADVFAQ